MNVIKNERIIPCDIDGTLIEHIAQTPAPSGNDIVWVEDALRGGKIAVRRMAANIRLIEEESLRGAFILVWSRSGNAWAAEVVKALGLKLNEHIIMTKPLVYVDDLPVSEWLKDRVFLPQGTIYKK